MISVKLPFLLRVVALVAAVCIVAGAGLLTYRYFTRPTTLTVAAGSLDGEAVRAMSAIASRLASTNALCSAQSERDRQCRGCSQGVFGG